MYFCLMLSDFHCCLHFDSGASKDVNFLFQIKCFGNYNFFMMDKFKLVTKQNRRAIKKPLL